MILTSLPGKSRRASSLAESVLHVQKLRSTYSSAPFIAKAGILSFLDGEGRYIINDQPYNVSSENYVIINSNSSLVIEAEKHSIPFLLFFHPKLYAYNDSADLSIVERLHLSDDKLPILFKELYQLSTSSASFYALKADALVRSIYNTVQDRATLAGTHAHNLPVSKASTRLNLFKRIDYTRDWMHAHYSNPHMDLQKMAVLAGMNYHHYLRMFTNAFGITPKQYLIDTRLEKAKELLSNTDESISAICSSIGYQSVSSFSWLFRKKFNTPPSLYRN